MTAEEKRERKRIRMAEWHKANREKMNAASTAWQKANPEKAKAASARWREKNPEKARALYAAYRKNHLEKTRAASALWRKANPEKQKIASTTWRKENPEASRRYRHDRRASKKANGGKLSPVVEKKLLAFQKNRCAACRISLKKTGHHLDHIIPLARGGKNVDSNIQILCPTCNQKKWNKDPIAFMQERGFLL